MRKAIIATLVCIILGMVALYTGLHNKSTLGTGKIQFSIIDPQIVTAIELSTDSNSLILKKLGMEWMVCEAKAKAKAEIEEKVKANAGRIQDLLLLTQKIEILSPVSLSMKDQIGQQLDKGTSVRFYRNHKVILSVNLCRIEGRTYARTVKSGNIFSIAVKGYPEVDLMKVYNPLPALWKSRTFLDLAPQEIKSVTVRYPDNPNNGFCIQQSEKGILFLLGNSAYDTLKYADKNALNDYLNNFNSIEEVPETNETPGTDLSLQKHTALFTLDIKTFSGIAFKLTGYPKQESTSGNVNPDLFYGIDTGNALVLLRYTDFDPILVTREYFRKK